MTSTHPVRFLLALAAGLGLAAGACSHKAVESVSTDEDVPVGVAPAKTADTFEATIAATGRIAPAPGADWTITAPQPARIAAIPKNEGERVNVGDLLVTFDIPSLNSDLAARQSDLDQAKAHVDTSKAARDRIAGLVTRGVSPQRDLEAADLDYRQAQATATSAQVALDAAKLLSDRANVKARFPGIVAKRFHNVGDMVDASATDPILRVIDPARLEAVISVGVGDLARISAGRLVRITNPASGAVETAKIISLPAAVDSSSATSDVRAAFDKPTHLAVGTPVNAEIVAERKTKVTVIPTAAIMHEGNETFVMVAGQDDDKAHKTPVKLGLLSRDQAEVLSGVKAGDLVIVRGQQGLPDDADIAIAK